MARVRLLRSAELDLDALGHVHELRRLPDVTVERPVCADWALIARAGFRLGRGEADDTLVTIGESALLAASLLWRGVLVHVPVGMPTNRELWLLKGRFAHADVIVSSLIASAALTNAGLARDRVRHRPASVPTASIDRAAARKSLGLDVKTIVVHVPGTVRPDSGHRRALWAVAILAYRDPSWRFYVSDRGDSGHAGRFITDTAPGGSVAVAYGVAEETLASAADVSVFCTEGVPERSSIARAMAAGSHIVAPASLWRREGLAPSAGVRLTPTRKPRAIARAVLESSEAARLPPTASEDASAGWAEFLSDRPNISRVSRGSA